MKTATKTNTKANTSAGNTLDWYADTLTAWPTQYAGPAPAKAHFDAAHKLGAKAGTKTAVALAMYMRPTGATQAQVTVINNGPYLNKMRAAVQAGHADVVAMPAKGGHKVYRLKLPVAKAKAPAKAKRKAPAKPVSEAPAASNATS